MNLESSQSLRKIGVVHFFERCFLNVWQIYNLERTKGLYVPSHMEMGTVSNTR